MGSYCHECGQLDKNLYRPLSEIVLQSLGNFIAFDTRFFRTVKPLLFRPGTVARDFMQGRYVRYTPPVQLFFFSSIVLFLLLNLVNLTDKDNHVTTDSSLIAVDFSSPRNSESPRIARSNDTNNDTKRDTKQTETAEESPEKANSPRLSGGVTETNREEKTADGGSAPDLSQLKQMDVSYLPGPLKDWVKSELQKADSKFRRLRADPQALAALVLRHMPLALFLMVPFLALALKGLYVFSGRYYTEHLIFALYLHSFFFLWTALANAFILASRFTGDWSPGQLGQVLIGVFWLWLPVYVLLALRHFYAQGWAMSAWKYFWLMLVYLVLLASVITAVGIISLLQF